MSTSLLYHGWGIRGYNYVKTSYGNGAIMFKICQDPQTVRCSNCGSGRVLPRGQIDRTFRSLGIGSKPVNILFPIPRVYCTNCKKTRQVRIGFADRRRSYTRSFERYALELSAHMTIQAVANHLRVSWDVIKDIQKRHLRRHFQRPRLKDLKRIAIDEISIGKAHRYLTVVLDIDSGAVVFVGEGKGADSLTRFWKKLRCAGTQIEAVATDMSPAYTFAVRNNLPNAKHVFDRFHVIKLYNDKLSDLRRNVQQTAETVEQKQVVKGTRWLLLKNPSNLDKKRKEQERLDDALRINQPLATAYYMKEDLREFWNQKDKRTATEYLDDWIARAESSGISMLKKFARTLILHRVGLLAWYDYPISTGPLEGTNNKIKTMQRQAYGYRDQEFFRLKIFAIHKAKYALVG